MTRFRVCPKYSMRHNYTTKFVSCLLQNSNVTRCQAFCLATVLFHVFICLNTCIHVFTVDFHCTYLLVGSSLSLRHRRDTSEIRKDSVIVLYKIKHHDVVHLSKPTDCATKE